MKPWMWLALAGGVALYLYVTKRIDFEKHPIFPSGGEPEPRIPPSGEPPADYVDMIRRPIAGDEEFVDVGEELVKQLYGYSVAPRADQVRWNGGH